MTEAKKPAPSYTGLKMYAVRSGFAIWVPSDWYQYELKDKRKGVLFSPYPDDFNTGFFLQKHRLKFKINQNDLPILREAFMSGIKALDGVEILEGTESEYITNTLSFFEVRYTFLEGEARRKRWIRNVYWAKNNYVLIAQGRTPEDFDYWLPMFYNTMMTAIV